MSPTQAHSRGLSEKQIEVAAYLDDPFAVQALVDAAATIAVDAHQGQEDKQGKPYIDHVFRVATGVLIDFRPQPGHRVLDSTAGPQVLYIVALLHDVVEDAITIADLRSRLERVEDVPEEVRDEIISAVEAITREVGESYEHYLGRVLSNPLARLVKIHDVADNFGRIGDLPVDERPRLAAKYTTALAVLR